MDTIGLVIGIIILATISIALLNYASIKKWLNQKKKAEAAAPVVSPVAPNSPTEVYVKKIEMAAESIKLSKEACANLRSLIATVERALVDDVAELRLLEQQQRATGKDISSIKTALESRISVYQQKLAGHRSSYQRHLDTIAEGQNAVASARTDARLLGLSIPVTKAEIELGEAAAGFTRREKGLDMSPAELAKSTSSDGLLSRLRAKDL